MMEMNDLPVRGMFNSPAEATGASNVRGTPMWVAESAEIVTAAVCMIEDMLLDKHKNIVFEFHEPVLHPTFPTLADSE
jgi:hypothetical protein